MSPCVVILTSREKAPVYQKAASGFTSGGARSPHPDAGDGREARHFPVSSWPAFSTDASWQQSQPLSEEESDRRPPSVVVALMNQGAWVMVSKKGDG